MIARFLESVRAALGGGNQVQPAPDVAPLLAPVTRPVPVLAVGDPLTTCPPQLLELITRFEGFREDPYLCPRGIPTIGYGTTIYPDGRAVTLHDPRCTKAQALGWAAWGAREAVRVVQAAVKVPLTAGQLAALGSFVHNIGPGGPTKDGFVRLKTGQPSTMLRLLNAGDYAGAAAEFPKWNQAGGVALVGLSKRRAAEQALFLGKAGA